MSERKQDELLLDKRELTRYDNYIEYALDEAEYLSEKTTERLTHEEVFSDLRRTIHG